jgi:hypothetical protein
VTKPFNCIGFACSGATQHNCSALFGYLDRAGVIVSGNSGDGLIEHSIHNSSHREVLWHAKLHE